MAKKSKKMAPRVASTAAPTAAQAVIQVINERDFASLNKRCTATEKEMTEERSSLGGMIAAAVETKHLHKGAFSVFRRLDKMSDRKRSEFLHHLDYYRSLSTWDDQLDLFRTQAGNVAEDEESDAIDAEEPEDRANGRGHRDEVAPSL